MDEDNGLLDSGGNTWFNIQREWVAEAHGVCIVVHLGQFLA